MTTENDLLTEANELTQEMRRLETRIKEINCQRRGLIRQCWDEGMTQRTIAQALNVTTQTVWNEIHRKDNKSEPAA